MHERPNHRLNVDQYASIELSKAPSNLWQVISQAISRLRGYDFAVFMIALITLVALFRGPESVWLSSIGCICLTVLAIAAGVLARGNHGPHSTQTSQSSDESRHG